jgi:hypothetical protein
VFNPTEATGEIRGTPTSVAVQTAPDVTSGVVPSLIIATALNGWVLPFAIEAVAGVTRIDITVAFVTVKIAEPDLPPKPPKPTTVAVMVDWPETWPVATPDGKIVATPPPGAISTAVQVEDAVTSLDDPSLYVPVAVYCWVPVTGINAVAGVTLTETKPCKTAAEPPKIGSRPPPPFPHPATKATSSNAMNHLSGLYPATWLPSFGNLVEWLAVPSVTLSNLFICFSSI